MKPKVPELMLCVSFTHIGGGGGLAWPSERDPARAKVAKAGGGGRLLTDCMAPVGMAMRPDDILTLRGSVSAFESGGGGGRKPPGRAPAPGLSGLGLTLRGDTVSLSGVMPGNPSPPGGGGFTRFNVPGAGPPAPGGGGGRARTVPPATAGGNAAMRPGGGGITALVRDKVPISGGGGP